MSLESLTLQRMLQTYERPQSQEELAILARAITEPSELGYQGLDISPNAMTRAAAELHEAVSQFSPEAITGFIKFQYDAGLDTATIGSHYKNTNAFALSSPRESADREVRAKFREEYDTSIGRRAAFILGYQSVDNPLFTSDELMNEWDVADSRSAQWRIAMAYVNPKEVAQGYNNIAGYETLTGGKPVLAANRVMFDMPHLQEAGLYEAVAQHMSPKLKDYVAKLNPEPKSPSQYAA